MGKLILSHLFISLSLFFIAYGLPEFEEYKKSLMLYNDISEFEKYREEILKEFDAYKAIVYEEFKNYKKLLSNIWDEPEIPDKEKFVEYSPSLKEKKVVDFKKGTVRISVITKNKKQAVEKIKQSLKDLLLEDKITAYKRDVVVHRIENRIKNFKHIKTSKINNQPIVSDVLLKEITPKEIDRFVENKVDEKKIKETVNKKTKGEKIYTLEIKFEDKNLLRKAKAYSPIVKKFSEKYNLPPNLVLAVIHTESYFNPYAKSPVPAYGLMQIVPFSAGRDITKFLYGRSFILSPSYLFNDFKNIEAGTTYLYLLEYRYLKDIRNPESRLYCAIASYNTGVGNLARVFTGTTNLKKAVRKINTLSPEEVYRTLLEDLPYKETKDYLKKIKERMELYEELGL